MSVTQIDYKNGTGLYVGEMKEPLTVTVPSARNYSYIYFARFEIHTAILMAVLIVLQSIVSYQLVNIYRRFEGACSLHF